MSSIDKGDECRDECTHLEMHISPLPIFYTSTWTSLRDEAMASRPSCRSLVGVDACRAAVLGTIFTAPQSL